MNLPKPVRLFPLLCLAVPLCAQTPAPQLSTLPATAPTETAPAQSPANRPTITWQTNQLTVAADNSSLNQILHEISRATGMTVTGGVKEERVFGKYGPGTASEVIGQLLDGTGSNLLFIGATGKKPAELILTPRNGGPTPPNPNAMRFENAPTEPVNPPPPPEAEATPPPPATPPESSAPAANGASGANGSSGASQSSDGPKTPQQIYEELMKLRQQPQNQQK